MKITLKQLMQLQWKMIAHASTERKHTTTYAAEVNGIRIVKNIIVGRKGIGIYSGSIVHLTIAGKTYDSYKSAVEAINTLLEKGEKK